MLGNDNSSSLISAAEQGLRDTTYTTNVKNRKIEDYVSKHMKFHSTLNDQKELGTYSGMFKKQKVDKFLDGLKHSHFIGLRSMILCNPKILNDFNATTAHVKNMVNGTPQLKNPPGRQVSAMGRGGGRGRGTERGGCDGCAGSGGRRYDSGRGHGGRGNDRGRRGERSPNPHAPNTHTFNADKCPDQDAVDRAKPGIVGHYVTGNRIFMGDHVYNSEMTAAERHAVYQIRADLNANKDPLSKLGRKLPLRWRPCSILWRSCRSANLEVHFLTNFPRGSLLAFRSALI